LFSFWELILPTGNNNVVNTFFNMKKTIFCLLFTLFLVNQSAVSAKVHLAYYLEIKPNVMHVRLNYIPVIPDSTTFQYGSSNGGMKDLLNSLVNIQSSVKFRIDSVNRKITFYYRDKTPVKITYDIIDTHKPAHRVVGEMFRPIVTDNYFFSLTPTLFLNPDIEKKLQDSLMMSVTLNRNAAFPMYFSFAPELKPGETVNLKLSEGIDALVTGASDLHIEKREMAGIKNYIVLRINEKNTDNLKRFMTYFDAFLPAMTNFWGNLNGTYYTLVASPFLDIKYHNISGTSFNGGFHVKYAGDTILANEEVVITISHEIMHRYIGSGCVSINGDNQWFNEGFTDYTTWYLLAQSGTITTERFKAIVKDTYNKLATNPVRNTPNEDIMKHFWENHNYEKLPYQRGAMFAAYIDKRIAELSNGSKTYRDFMRNLKALAEQKKEMLTVDDFISVASKYIPKAEIEASIKLYIMQGEMIPEKMIL
jgi:predicted metalloprotease with PDZ domain